MKKLPLNLYFYSILFLFYLFINPLKAQNVLLPLDQQVQEILAGTSCGHFHFHKLPMVCQMNIEDNILNLQLEMEANESIREDLYDHLLESFLPALHEYALSDVKFFIKKSNEAHYINVADLYQTTPLPSFKPSTNKDPFPNIRKSAEKGPGNPHIGQNLATGSLSGKTVWLSPGHGWMNDDGSGWLTQRGTTNGMVEDFGSIESLNYYLQKYLMNAGANVWMVRERDVNTNEVIVDNDDGAPTYTETGAWGTSSSTGYNGGTYRFLNSNASESATATYTPTITEEGWYWISVFYREGANRPIDVRYKVNHAGGETIVSINQEIHGMTWVYLGEFYFDAGSDGNVTLSNESSDTGQAVIADAVRFGGGMGSMGDCAFGGATSGRPRFEEAARQYAHFQGYSTCESDVVIRPRYAEWELAKGTATEQANAVYISWHTNAFTGSAFGTETYHYNGLGSNPNITAGSPDLRNFIHAELINDIQGEWDPAWNDRGTKVANFGELRELSTMPGALIEVAFHDNVNDAMALKTPAFRNLAARAVYQGIVKFFNNRDNSPATLLPEPPTHLFARNSNSGEISLSWNAPPAIGASGIIGDAATSYRVYWGEHGKGFQNEISVNNTNHTFTGLNPETTYYFQVSAINDGGESFPTATVAARTPLGGFEVPYLLVDGFDRLDRSAAIVQNESTALGNVERGFLERMNRYDYMVDHARSFDNCGVSFDGAANEAVIDGIVNLNCYEGLDWILGEESTIDNTLNTAEQNLLIDFFDNTGGKLIISGAEIGWDIGRSSSPNAALSFYNNYLKATYTGDDSNTYNFSGVGGGIFDGISGMFDDSNNGYYDVEFPDRLTPTNGSTVALNYMGGSADGAAVAYNGTDFGVVNFGFPLEAVTDASVRNALLCAAIEFLTPNISCPINENISNTTYTTGQSAYIVVGNAITSDNTIVQNGATVTYDAGIQVCLDSGFEVTLGAEFSAMINGCTNLQTTKVEEEK